MSGELLAGRTVLLVLFGLVGLLQLAVAAYTAGVLRLEDGFGHVGDSTDPSRASDDSVTCPECGTENEVGYRFCRNCVQTLPGAAPRRFSGGGGRMPV